MLLNITYFQNVLSLYKVQIGGQRDEGLIPRPLPLGLDTYHITHTYLQKGLMETLMGETIHMLVITYV
jgi:hypothetical protein